MAGKKRYGEGINDMKGMSDTPVYDTWASMLMRCYCSKFQAKRPSYVGCTVIEEWKTLSKFKEWFDLHWIEGYHLDKDLFDPSNKQYGPNKCFFVPPRLNNLFLVTIDRELPTGVHKITNKNLSRPYWAFVETRDGRVDLGRYSTPDEASVVYQKAKKSYVLSELDIYEKEGVIDPVLLATIRKRVCCV